LIIGALIPLFELLELEDAFLGASCSTFLLEEFVELKVDELGLTFLALDSFLGASRLTLSLFVDIDPLLDDFFGELLKAAFFWRCYF
jgi:hypothetical protein